MGGAGLTPQAWPVGRTTMSPTSTVAGCSTHGTRADLAGEHYQPVIDAIGRLLSACQDAGRVRPDVDADELLLLVSFRWRDDRNAGGEESSRRMLRIVLDGLGVLTQDVDRPRDHQHDDDQ